MSNRSLSFSSRDRIRLKGSQNPVVRGIIGEVHFVEGQVRMIARWEHGEEQWVGPDDVVKEASDSESDDESDSSEGSSDSPSSPRESTGSPAPPAVVESSGNSSGRGGGRGNRGGRRGGGRGGRGRSRGSGRESTRAAAPPTTSQPEAAQNQPSASSEDVLKPHGQVWTVREPASITVDAAYVTVNHPRHFTLRWSSVTGDLITDEIKCPVQYFLLSYPKSTLEATVRATQANIASDIPRLTVRGNSRGTINFDLHRWLRFLGITLSMALFPLRGGLDAYFREHDEKGRLREHGRYGSKYGMSVHEFKGIRQYLKLTYHSDADVIADPWTPIRGFIDAFNARRREVVVPGQYICADELMSSWEGVELTYHSAGMPHVQKIKRKPKGIGAELKCSADCESGVMLKLEIVEGKGLGVRKYELPPENLPHHTAITLRLVEDWFSTNRTVVADSAFASVGTAEELLKRGLHFQGIVKTATKRYPMKYLKNVWEKGEKPKRGDYRVLTSQVAIGDRAAPIIALGWVDSATKFFVSTCGTTTKGNPHQVQRTRVETNEQGIRTTVKYTKSTECPKLLNNLFDAFNAVDVHDHYRQGTLGLERHWKTHKWWHRIFATVFGIIVTDAYFMYRHDFQRLHGFADLEKDLMPFEEWTERLAHDLIFYGDSNVTRSRKRKKHADSDDSYSIEPGSSLPHQLMRLKDTPYYLRLKAQREARNQQADTSDSEEASGTGVKKVSQQKARRCCVECGKLTAYYCRPCSQDPDNLQRPKYVPICFVHPECFVRHCQEN